MYSNLSILPKFIAVRLLLNETNKSSSTVLEEISREDIEVKPKFKLSNNERLDKSKDVIPLFDPQFKSLRAVQVLTSKLLN